MTASSRKLLFLFLLFSRFAVANIDSLNQRLAQKPDDTTRVQIYLKLSWAYKDVAPEKAQEMVEKAINHAKTTHYTLGLANAYYYQAILYYLKGNYADASVESEKARPLYVREKSDYGLASLLNLLGLIHMQQAFYPEALKCFQEVYEIGEKNADLYSLSNAINNIAIIYERTGNYSGALAANLKALEVRKKIGAPVFIAESYLEIAISYYKLKNYDSSRYYLIEAKPIFEQHSNTRSLASVYNSLGTIGLDEKQFGVAHHYFLMSAELLAPLDDKHLYVPVLVNLGQVQYELGQFNAAEKTLLACKAAAEELHDFRNLAFAFEWLSKLKESQGNYKLALAYERQRLNVIDSILSEEKANNSLNSTPASKARVKKNCLPNSMCSSKNNPIACSSSVFGWQDSQPWYCW